MAERKYINGLYFNKKYPKSPEFVLGRGAIDPERLRKFLDENPLAEGEKYINFQIVETKTDTNKGTFVVDTWRPTGATREINTDAQQEAYDKKQAKQAKSQEEISALYGDPINPEDIPF